MTRVMRESVLRVMEPVGFRDQQTTQISMSASLVMEKGLFVVHPKVPRSEKDHLTRFMDWLNEMKIPLDDMAVGMLIVSKWLEDTAKKAVQERDMSQKGQP